MDKYLRVHYGWDEYDVSVRELAEKRAKVVVKERLGTDTTTRYQAEYMEEVEITMYDEGGIEQLVEWLNENMSVDEVVHDARRAHRGIDRKVIPVDVDNGRLVVAHDR